MTASELDDLKSFALVAFLCDCGCDRLLELDAKVVEKIGAQAGLDAKRTERAMALVFGIYSAKREELTTWLRRNTN